MKRERFWVVAVAMALAARSEPAFSIVNGGSAVLADFPAIGSFGSGNGESCTSVLVGPQALLTAAHCVDSCGKGIARFTSTAGQAAREAFCTVALDLDLAVCLLNSKIENILAERLNSKNAPSVGGQLLLAGFGCDGSPGSSGPFRTGATKIISFADDDIRIGQGAFLCGGDSGGPAYLLQSATDPTGPRVVAGINDNDLDVTNVTMTAARDFLRGWTEKHPEATICGFTPGAQGCRD